MKKGIRHGDVCLIQAKKPTGLKKSDTKTLLAVGSGGNPHTFEQWLKTISKDEAATLIDTWLKNTGTETFKKLLTAYGYYK